MASTPSHMGGPGWPPPSRKRVTPRPAIVYHVGKGGRGGMVHNRGPWWYPSPAALDKEGIPATLSLMQAFVALPNTLGVFAYLRRSSGARAPPPAGPALGLNFSSGMVPKRGYTAYQFSRCPANLVYSMQKIWGAGVRGFALRGRAILYTIFARKSGQLSACGLGGRFVSAVQARRGGFRSPKGWPARTKRPPAPTAEYNFGFAAK